MIEVQGRSDDSLVMAGRDGQPLTVLPLALTTVLEEEARVFDFQLRQQSKQSLVLRLDLHGAEAAPAVARCRSILEKFALMQGLAPIRVTVELGHAIPRGHSGKLQRVMAQPRRTGRWCR